ncbi:N-acetylmuramoyl-L-alanine amidase [Altererythrobacter aerius]|uniref:N-acetylmuramoyl-L-alanine amidase n=1 Tax=Tsuneonella aeria TaxID=1837929 RepID=A0A6I4TDA9_9SPHN|nr:N-acetylmuramoyl-L-alanine amidase [Tsuneonella aeria]MXO74140.1 N-acetylmuramoyl-L-alanine amidase [Tsuneonella aeria]
MSRRAQLSLFLLAPVLVMAAILAAWLALAVPALGRDYVLRFELPPAGERADLPRVLGPPDRSRPLIVIDAGHGGHDPGATAMGFQEKDLVLALAAALREELIRRGGTRVAMTREDDRFLALGERSAIARDLGADLFLSIHADSAGEADAISGSSIYVLSEEASSATAARYAARENAADAVNGVRLSEQSDTVNSILVDLAQRGAQNDSAAFARLIQREGRGILQFHPETRRSAALAVLRAPDVPSVLYEAGFISNPDDAERLASPAGQQAFAQVLARAVSIYFARQSDVR